MTKRRNFSTEFKAKVALATIRGEGAGVKLFSYCLLGGFRPVLYLLITWQIADSVIIPRHPQAIWVNAPNIEDCGCPRLLSSTILQ